MRTPHSQRSRWGRLGAVAGVIVLGLLPVLFAVPASGQVPFATAPVSASATGTVFHAGALESDDTRLVDTEVAFSGAAFNTEGQGKALLNEVKRVYAPKTDKAAYARASGLEAGLGVTPDTENQIIVAGKAESFAPPTTDPVTEEIGPADLAPLAWGSLLRGRAATDYTTGECTIGTDLANGNAFVADAQLLDAAGAEPPDPAAEGLTQPLVALDANNPDRAVSQSTSRNLLVAQRNQKGEPLGPNFGVMGEVRQTIAPVTLFTGTENEVTIEFLGEWVLRAVATGLDGGAYVHYGPGSDSPDTPVLRFIDQEGATTVLRTQDFFDAEGLVIEIPDVAEIVIGEDPRAIGGNADSKPTAAPNGTAAAGAVDVVRVRTLAGAPDNIVDTRLGHMEVSAMVPPGGVTCPLPVTKTPNPASVVVGDTFTVTLDITNPYDCTLTNVTLTDDITVEDAARFEVLSTSPEAPTVPQGTDLSSGTIEWTGLPDIKPGDKLTVTAEFKALGGAGVIVDKATATASLGNCAGGDVAGVAVADATVSGDTGDVRIPVAAVEVAAAFGEPSELPKTGGQILAMIAIGMALVSSGGVAMLIARRFR